MSIGRSATRTALVAAICCVGLSCDNSHTEVDRHATIDGLALDSTPVLRIGEGDPQQPEEVYTAPVGPVLVGDSLVVLGDAKRRWIRAFSLTGDFLWEAGGVGGGPNEFPQLLRDIFATPDDYIVGVGAGGKALVLTSDGTAVSNFMLPQVAAADAGATSVAAVGATIGGGLVVARRRTPEGPSRTTWIEVIVLGPDGSVRYVHGPLRGSLWRQVQLPDGRSGYAAVDDVVLSAGGERFVIGMPGDSALGVFDLDGRLQHRVRVDGAAVYSADLGGGNAFHADLPGVWVKHVRIAPDGAMWVGTFDRSDGLGYTWHSFSPLGMARARGKLHRHPLAVGIRFLATFERGRFDEPVLAVYGIRGGGPARR